MQTSVSYVRFSSLHQALSLAQKFEVVRRTLNNQPPSGVKSLKDDRVGGKFAADDDNDVIIEDHHDDNGAQAGFNNLLMVAEIKMTETLKARKSLNSWKLKLQQETHEEGRQQMIEA